MRPLPTLLTLAIAAAFGGFVATGINAHLDNRADAAPLPAVVPTTAALPASVAGQAVPSLAPMLEKAMPAVVSVNTKQVVRVRNPFFNDPHQRIAGLGRDHRRQGRAGADQPPCHRQRR
jgi:serine protease DegQ